MVVAILRPYHSPIEGQLCIKIEEIMESFVHVYRDIGNYMYSMFKSQTVKKYFLYLIFDLNKLFLRFI